MDKIKLNPKDLDSPCQELSNAGLEISVGLPFSGIDFSCVYMYWGRDPAVSSDGRFG